MQCPNCKSEDIKHVEQRDDNGIYGSGYRSWVTHSYYLCKICGTMFQKPEDIDDKLVHS